MSQPLVGIVMGSDSDWGVMQHAARELQAFGVPHESRVVSAHRTPDLLYQYAEQAPPRGLRCIMPAPALRTSRHARRQDLRPVLGVPVPSRHLNGVDSLLSIVQMPGGIPWPPSPSARPGARNAGLFAVAMLARTDTALAGQLDAFRRAQTDKVLGLTLPEPS
ncbi:MAG: AIR carboxylase family protein [Gemmatimonadetes bacterium]|nr:AIR carboxylase family protein [Gemmatimonadota bacterium]